MLRTSLITSFLLFIFFLAPGISCASCCVCECRGGTQPSFVEPNMFGDTCSGCESSCSTYGGVRRAKLVLQSCASMTGSNTGSNSGCGQPTRAQLKEAISWAIFHEGCRIYQGEGIRLVSELRACYVEKQKHCVEVRNAIDHASVSELEEITREAAVEIPRGHNIPDAFHWVCAHEKMGKRIHDARGNMEDIRTIYHKHNRENPNLLAAVPDSYVVKLVAEHCPAVASEKEKTNAGPHEGRPGLRP